MLKDCKKILNKWVIYMDYIHQIVDSDILADLFNLPATLKGRMVEVIILPVPEKQELGNQKKSAFGCLKKYANQSLISKENEAWEQAVKEKYENR